MKTSTTGSLQSLSLLWPQDVTKEGAPSKGEHKGDWEVDLGLDEVGRALDIDGRHAATVRSILLELCSDPAVILYRQEVLEDFLRPSGLASRLESILPMMAELGRFGGYKRWDQEPLLQTVRRLEELALYVDSVKELHSILEEARGISSEGLKALLFYLTSVVEDRAFRSLAEELPKLRAGLEGLASVTIGVNLDSELRPVEATLVSINPQKFSGESLLDRLLNKGKDSKEYQGIARLHRVDEETSNPFLQPLFRDLGQLLSAVTRPIASALARYAHVKTSFLVALEPEIVFYLGAKRLIERLRSAGLPVCRPEASPMGERLCVVKKTYNLNLALRLLKGGVDLGRTVVTNDVGFDEPGRIFILTGPNRGGKTTYTQAVGLLQVLFQAGLYVPGARARMSPVDGIYTHFPVVEKLNLDTGRLGEEAKRLNDIFHRATRHSLVLLNESLSSTSPAESLYLCRDVVSGLCLLGARGIFATHLHELARDVSSINSGVQSNSQVVSLVAGTVERDGSDGASEKVVERTYKIAPGPPLGMSYAAEIASQYGISLSKIVSTLRERNVLDPG
jgi:hypothetical protein